MDTNNLEVFWELDYRKHLVHRALQLMQPRVEPRIWTACWELVVAGRPGTEVATELAMTEGAVYVARCRVMTLLRAELEGLLD